MNLQELNEFIKNQINVIERENVKFIQKFDDNPAYALAWSQEVFEKNAKLVELQNLENLISKDRTIFDIKGFFTNQLNSAARYPERSTSVQSNEMSLMKTKALAEIVELLANVEA